jgi:hypothetical protein
MDLRNPLVPDHVEFGEPVLSKAEAKIAWDEFKDSQIAAFQAAGVPWTDWTQREAYYRFKASTAYLGPLTAKAFAGWCKRELKIQLKDGPLVAFELNPMQFRWATITLDETYLKDLPVRQVILKARQFGFSTAIQALAFYFSSTESGFNTTTIAHKGDATSHLHEMSRRFLRNLIARPRTERTNGKILRWAPPHDSRISLETAGNKEAGRSLTNRLLHMSEIAFWEWPETTRLGIVQTCPNTPGSFIFEESTANGVGGTFHDQYWRARQGKGDYRGLFFGWHENPKYALTLRPTQVPEILSSLDREEREGIERWGWTPGQIAWRRMMIEDACEGSVLKFHQEYPSYDREAFLVSGRPVFDQQILQTRLQELEGNRENGVLPVHPIFQGALAMRA